METKFEIDRYKMIIETIMMLILLGLLVKLFC